MTGAERRRAFGARGSPAWTAARRSGALSWLLHLRPWPVLDAVSARPPRRQVSASSATTHARGASRASAAAIGPSSCLEAGEQASPCLIAAGWSNPSVAACASLADRQRPWPRAWQGAPALVRLRAKPVSAPPQTVGVRPGVCCATRPSSLSWRLAGACSSRLASRRRKAAPGHAEACGPRCRHGGASASRAARTRAR